MKYAQDIIGAVINCNEKTLLLTGTEGELYLHLLLLL